MTTLLWILLKSKAWENFFRMIFFLMLAYALYRFGRWNVKFRREKNMSEIRTRGNLFTNWAFVISLLFAALVCFVRLLL